MKKLISWLKRIDDNLLHYTLLIFIVVFSLAPKIPLKNIEYTYIKFRIDDIFPIIVGVIFLVQWIRKKVRLNTKFLIIFCVYWLAVFLSFYIGAYIKNTIVIEGIGYLHSVRRIQYMFIFFVASSVVTSEKRFRQYMITYLVTVGLVSLYGIGQKFLSFPSIQTMNPAYADGRILYLNQYDRINSTFGGQFDLAGYLTISLPIILGFFFAYKQKRYILLYLVTFVALLYTAMRSAFGAYVVSIPALLLIHKKFRMLIFVVIASVLLTLVTGQMIRRFSETLAVKTVYVNTQTNQTSVAQQNTPQDLPHGGPALHIPLPLTSKQTSTNQAPAANPEEIQKIAIEQATQELKQQGRVLNTQEINNRASQISKYLKPQKSLLCDISCSVRLEVEWPRAIGAFLYDPLFGTGPSSITEATDNDLLRALGETGLVGFFLFSWILVAICRYVLKATKYVPKDDKMIYTSFVFGVIALVLNAFYVDVFEASKVAYNFWIVAGLYVGVTGLIINEKNTNGKRERTSSEKD